MAGAANYINEKMEIEADLHIQLTPNKKRIYIHKKNRRVIASISVLRSAKENRKSLDDGETISYDTFWQMNVEDWNGIDYVCFHRLGEDMIRIK